MCTTNKPKRLLCIVSNMDAGGAETFLMKMYRQLDRTCYQMDFVVSGDGRGYYEDEIERLGGRVFRITRKTKDFSAYRRELFDAVREDGCPVVLRIGSNAFSAIDLWIAKRAGARRLALRSSNASDGQAGLGMLLQRALRRPLTSVANVKIAPSDLAAEYTFGPMAMRKGEVHYLRNALDLDAYAFSAEKRTAIRAEFSIDADALVVGHVGRFAPQKNHGFLIEVFTELLKSRPDARLVLVGKGELEDEVCAKAEAFGVLGSIVFTGVRSDVPALLSAFDALALPSLYEGMPNVVIEAQAAGLSCVVSDTVTRQADVTGLVEYLPIDNTTAWAKVLESAATVERLDTRTAMTAAGYDISSEAKKFVELVYGVATIESELD
ncbi:glycosyltransferase family 1 protein [Collinsella sp. AM24-1]|nr:glycosyltransferase family 1 protein [Collinsella sp. AM24-1]